MTTLYWHDYETWGEVPARDRPAQFAGLRTDTDLNPIGDPLEIYCQPATDVLPKPDACLITGITPQTAMTKGIPEPRFIAAIHAELALPGTCGVGYNTLRFDDEVTRYALYRNFFDPYEREWKGGNSRWDIIDMVRLTHALRPEGIEWPSREDGLPSFKLEHLTAANGISHVGAHDALSDVRATVELARLIKTRQPALYDHVFELRRKQAVARLIDLKQRKPLLHISSKISAANGCAAVVAPLAMHPLNKNAVIVCNLSANPEPLLALSAEEIRHRLYLRSEMLDEDEERIPLKLVHLNKCPVLTTVKLLDSAAAQRCQIDLARCEAHWQRLRGAEISAKLQAVFSRSEFEPSSDPEQQLYDGFIADADKRICERVRRSSPQQLAGLTAQFTDPRLQELLFRYRARHFSATLTDAERQKWEAWRKARLTDPALGGGIVLQQMHARIAEIRALGGLTSSQELILSDLESYALKITGVG